MKLKRLHKFRQNVYNQMGAAKDAVFELMDAALLTRNPSCLAELSLSSIFRRKWHSAYEALYDCRPKWSNLLKLYTQEIPQNIQPILVADHSPYSRPDAVTLTERTYEYQPSSVSVNRPVGVGYGYSTVAYLPKKQGSWALPLSHERITSEQTPIEKVAAQLLEVCSLLLERPIILFDSQYGCAKLLLAIADVLCDKLMRLRSNRCLYGQPPIYSGRGRPQEHGHKFKLNDITTWMEPDGIVELDDPKLGKINLRVWHNYHFKESASHSMSIIRVEQLNSKKSKPLWLAWVGEKMPSLLEILKLYQRRFTIEHWYRFAKQRLHWTLPKLGTKEGCDKWSQLMPLMTWQLWLAHFEIADNPLPWQKPQTQLSPGRTAMAWAEVLLEIGTPTRSPKPRGKSPGWQKGKKRKKKVRCPIVKKGRGVFESKKKAKKLKN